MLDINKIDDIVVLKSLAYDQIAKKERAEENLSMLNGRIAYLIENQPAPVDTIDEPQEVENGDAA